MRTRQSQPSYEPLALLNMLSDCAMHLLSPQAWKVVSFIARLNIEHCFEEWEATHNPLRLLQRDISRVTRGHLGEDLPPSQDQIAKVERDFAVSSILSSGGASRRDSSPQWWSTVSIHEICEGIRHPKNRRYRTCGTGMPKTSAVQGINEALSSGILQRRRRKNAKGRDLPSAYSIDWGTVLELEQHRRKKRSKTVFEMSKVV